MNSKTSKFNIVAIFGTESFLSDVWHFEKKNSWILREAHTHTKIIFYFFPNRDVAE